VRHHFKKRWAGSAADSASLGVEESAGAIGAVATLAKGGGGGYLEALEEDNGRVGLHGPHD
jgi:hypothetical protein